MPFLPHWPQLLGSRPIIFGLERVLALLERLGNPHLKLPPVLHVAGTNGKGSTIAYLRAMLEAAGYRVHVYTSPHLLQFNERIVLAGEKISDAYLHEIMEECRLAAGDDIQTTFFEGTTVGAFLAFSRVPADIILLETGMGGRLDATNVIPHPTLTLITPISLDHTDYLGPTLELIAGEKAGILKPQVPCVVSAQTEEVWNVIERAASRTDSPLIAFGFDWSVEKIESGFTLHIAEQESQNFPMPSLPGDHQILNAATAIMALLQLTHFNVSLAQMKQGIEQACWPARLQRITEGALFDALPTGYECFVDGAHNISGAQALRVALDSWEPLPTIALCGFTKGRNPKDFLSYLNGALAHCIGVLVQTEPSAIAPHHIEHAAQELEIPSHSADTIEEAFALIPTLIPPPARIVIAGSLYLASDFFKANGTKI